MKKEDLYLNLDLLVKIANPKETNLDVLSATLEDLNEKQNDLKAERKELKNDMTDDRYYDATSEIVDRNNIVNLKKKIARLNTKVKDSETRLNHLIKEEEQTHVKIIGLEASITEDTILLESLKERVSELKPDSDATDYNDTIALTEDNLKKYCKLVGKFPDLVSKKVLDYLIGADYFTAPSSFKYHGNWVGGNFDHSMKVTELLLEYTENEHLKWDREESPYIIGLFHDMCKSDQRRFKFNDGEMVIVSGNSPDRRHSEKSIELIERNIISMTVEEKLCIYYHMGEYGGDDEYQVLMAKLMEKNRNIKYTQMADTAAAKMGI